MQPVHPGATQIQMAILRKHLPDDQLLLYLWMCEQYRLTEHRNRLLNIGVKKRATELQQSKLFMSVPLSVRSELLEKRCLKIESLIDSFNLYSANCACSKTASCRFCLTGKCESLALDDRD
ncbi:hypothetical protein BaRGS_00020268 [Batillaria attramentaria]|uniref:Uncharacterized protein n=1 Tax=Batillaria attramentaria TaxID=370345 RepID=A0ABD0KMK3_9CAEN